MTNIQFIVILVLFAALVLLNIVLWARARKKDESTKPKTRYMKKIVLLCLSMLTGLTVACVALAWRAGEQLASETTVALCGAWGVEIGVLGKIKSDESKQESIQKSVEKYTQPQQPEP